MDDNRKKALNSALSQIERQFGKGAVMKMGDQPREAMPAVSTGSLGLDVALGIGGLPWGVWSRSSARKVPVKPPSPSR